MRSQDTLSGTGWGRTMLQQPIRRLPRDSELIQRYNAQFRQIQVHLCVARSAYPAVNALLEHHESKTQEHAAKQANRRIHRQTWTVGEYWRPGAIHHHDVAVAHGAGQACFLYLLKHCFVEPPVRVYIALQRVVMDDRKSTRLNSSHLVISYAVFCLKKK